MPTDWFVTSLPPILLVVLGTLVMYATIVLFARWSGVRSFAQMSTFDIAVTIAIGSLMATTVVAREPPLLHGMAALATLYTVQLLVSRLRRRYRSVERATDNAPILLMASGGRILPENLRIARVTENDLRAHLRGANVVDPGCVHAVVMEGTGSIHVLHGNGPAPAADAWLLRDVRDHHGGRGVHPPSSSTAHPAGAIQDNGDSMSRDTLYVVPEDAVWRVVTDESQGDADLPRYDDKEAAVSAAILSAQNSQADGRVARVLVQDDAGAAFREERRFDP